MTFKDGLIELAEAVWLVGTICLAFISWGWIILFVDDLVMNVWLATLVGLLMMILVFAATMWSIFRWIDH